MKMKKLLLVLLFMSAPLMVQAQQNATLTAASSSCTSTSCLSVKVDPNQGGATFTVSSNTSGNTIQFEATGDGGTTWVALNATPSNSTTAATSTTGTGTWQANVAGFTNARQRMSILVAGSTTVSIVESTASARAGGGGGGGGGGGLPSGCTSPGTGAITCTGTITDNITSSNSVGANFIDIACAAQSVGNSNQNRVSCDGTNAPVVSINGTTAVKYALIGGPAGSAQPLSALGAATTTNTLANGNNEQDWNCALTSDAIECMAFGETSAATGGTLTSGMANQAIVEASTATNSTATPFNVVQGSITNTVATPLAQFQGTWNNASLVGQGIVENITNTASTAAGSGVMNLKVNGTSVFNVDTIGNVLIPQANSPSFLVTVNSSGSDAYSLLGRDGVYVSAATRGVAFWSTRVNSSSIDGNLSRVGPGVIGVGTGGLGSVAGTMQGAAFLSTPVTHAVTVPITIGSGTSIGSTTLCATADCPAGTYVIPTYIDITTACGTSGTYIVNLIYTDDQGTKTIPININGTGSVPATGTLTTTSTANYGENSQVIHVTSGNINYSTVATSCGTAGPMVGKLYMVANQVL